MPALPLGSQREPFADTGAEAAVVTWGEMVASSTLFPAGFDGTESLREVSGDRLCTVTHWGYVVSGSLSVRFTDGRVETARAGESFFVAAGHAPFTEEGAEVVEFSPAAESAEQMARFAVATSGGAA